MGGEIPWKMSCRWRIEKKLKSTDMVEIVEIQTRGQTGSKNRKSLEKLLRARHLPRKDNTWMDIPDPE